MCYDRERSLRYWSVIWCSSGTMDISPGMKKNVFWYSKVWKRNLQNISIRSYFEMREHLINRPFPLLNIKCVLGLSVARSGICRTYWKWDFLMIRSVRPSVRRSVCHDIPKVHFHAPTEHLFNQNCFYTWTYFFFDQNMLQILPFLSLPINLTSLTHLSAVGSLAHLTLPIHWH